MLYKHLPDLLGSTLDYLAKILAVLYHGERIDFWSWREFPVETGHGGPKILVSCKDKKPVRPGEVYLMKRTVPPIVRKCLAMVGDTELKSMEEEMRECFGTWNPMEEAMED